MRPKSRSPEPISSPSAASCTGVTASSEGLPTVTLPLTFHSPGFSAAASIGATVRNARAKRFVPPGGGSAESNSTTPGSDTFATPLVALALDTSKDITYVRAAVADGTGTETANTVQSAVVPVYRASR